MSLVTRYRDWRRRRLLDRHALPEESWNATLLAYAFFDRLDDDERARLRDCVSMFCASKEFAGAGGFTVTLQTQLAIAAQACLPILNLDLSLYDGWHGIIVYAGEMVARREVVDEDGVVHEYDEVIAGEAMPGGPVILSWEDVKLAGGEDAPSYNVVIHEFAHKIDMLKGEATGVPPFFPAWHKGLDGREFAKTLERAHAAFAGEVERWDKGEVGDDQAPLIDPYAAENPAEFFAVLSEAFFTMPADVLDAFPDLYDLLCAYYRQNPLEFRGVRPRLLG
ncbi:MAG: zinc-dependent peptidase [Burkholderiales bacterium]